MYPSVYDTKTLRYDSSSSIKYGTSYLSDYQLKPDIIMNYNSSTYVIDSIVAFDSISNMESAANKNNDKYSYSGYIIYVCVGLLESLHCDILWNYL